MGCVDGDTPNIRWILSTSDGLRAVTAPDREADARVWDLEKGTSRVLSSAQEGIREVVLLGDTRAVGFTTVHVIVWDLVRAEVLAVWMAPFGIERFAAAGNRIVVGGSKGRVVFLTLEE